MCRAAHTEQNHTAIAGPPSCIGTENTPAKAGVSQFHEVRYVQVNAEALSKMGPEELNTYATYLFLHLRFQSGIIHAALDKRTCKKAGVTRQTLKKYLYRIGNRPTGSILKRLAAKKSLAPVEAKDYGEARHQAAYRAPFDCWVLRDKHTMRSEVLPYILAFKTPTRARCTLKLHKGMRVHDIYVELQKKRMKHHIAQVLHQQDPPKGNQANTLATGAREYPDHPLKLVVPLPKDAAQVPSRAMSMKLNIHPATFFRRIDRWEREGSLQRIRRRVHLSDPGDRIAFREKWGIAPFKCGGLWYGQLPNLYIDTEDYQGGWGAVRKKLNTFGWSVTDIVKVKGWKSKNPNDDAGL